MGARGRSPLCTTVGNAEFATGRTRRRQPRRARVWPRWHTGNRSGKSGSAHREPGTHTSGIAKYTLPEPYSLGSVSLPEELSYRCLTLSVIECPRDWPCYDDDMDIGLETRSMGAIHFPDVTFDTVTHHGPADLARYDTANLASLTVPPGHITDESTAHPFLALAVYAQEFFAARESFSSRQCILARHNRLISSSLCGQPLASPAPSAANHLPPADRRHSGPKAVIALPLNIGRLKSPFHCWPLVILL